MALHKVIETSFIGAKLCLPGEVVDINTDVSKGGMDVGPNLAACDEDGNLLAEAATKKKASKPAAADLG